MKKFTQTIAMLALIISPTVVMAQSIFTNPITASNPSASNPFTTGQTVNSNITVSGVGRGPGITANAGSNRYNAANFTLSATIDLNDYFTFTITPNSGQEVDFVSLVYASQRSASGPSSFAFRSSLDGFTGNIGTPVGTGATIDLSGAEFQNISAPIEFRLYGFGATAGTGTFSIDDFTFNGTVGAPPPLPIKLNSFDLTKSKSSVNLLWNFGGMDGGETVAVERSNDGASFSTLAKMDVPFASSINQSYTDEAPLKGINYYRLAITSANGTTTYSKILSAIFSGKEDGSLSIYPNPAKGNVQVDWTASDMPSIIELYSTTGQLVWSQKVNATGHTEVPTATFPNGTYILNWKQGTTVKHQQIQVIH